MDVMCEHARVKPEIWDQTLGILCLDCNGLIALCWGDSHVPERLWNRACQSDSNAIPCEQNRDDVCALCRENIII